MELSSTRVLIRSISSSKPKCNMSYSQKKFLAQTQEKQHKECALLLKRILTDQEESLWKIYLEWMNWMNSTPPVFTPKHLADRYHSHLSQTRIHLKEHNFLKIQKQDKEASEPPLEITIYLENIRSAHNVGSIIRTTEGFSLGRLVFGGMTPLPTNKQVQDTAMGTVDWIDWSQGDLSTLPRPLIAIETSPDAIPIHKYEFPKVCTIAVGNEEYGCSDELLAEADVILRLPMYGRKNSLNVANAFACVAHQIRSMK